ncbi:MAG: hypothetical protein DRI57_20295 [Deltaproteobacteria bacterium]|nr:MAG: hypothetical protein DRI57_20295 [Deltaproteobacteria bacterium]
MGQREYLKKEKRVCKGGKRHFYAKKRSIRMGRNPDFWENRTAHRLRKKSRVFPLISVGRNPAFSKIPASTGII